MRLCALTMLPPLFFKRSFDAADFTFEHFRQPAFALLPQTFLVHAIYIRLDGPSNVEVHCNDKRNQQQVSRGDITIAPYRLSVNGASVGTCEFLQLSLKPALIDRAAKELGLNTHVELASVLGVVDPLAEQTIYQLEEELAISQQLSNHITVLVDTVAQHLVRHYAKNKWNKNSFGGFPKYLLDRALEYITDHRDRTLSSQEIARAVGVEPDRFANAFRATTGQDIDQYLRK